MVYKNIKKWVGVFVISLSIVPSFSSLKAEAIGAPVNGKHLQHVYALQKALHNSTLTLKAEAHQ